jgi:hypothetical protein
MPAILGPPSLAPSGEQLPDGDDDDARDERDAGDRNRRLRPTVGRRREASAVSLWRGLERADRDGRARRLPVPQQPPKRRGDAERSALE